jgi:hypothetical protein
MTIIYEQLRKAEIDGKRLENQSIKSKKAHGMRRDRSDSYPSSQKKGELHTQYSPPALIYSPSVSRVRVGQQETPNWPSEPNQSMTSRLLLMLVRRTNETRTSDHIPLQVHINRSSSRQSVIKVQLFTACEIAAQIIRCGLKRLRNTVLGIEGGVVMCAFISGVGFDD